MYPSWIFLPVSVRIISICDVALDFPIHAQHHRELPQFNLRTDQNQADDCTPFLCTVCVRGKPDNRRISPWIDRLGWIQATSPSVIHLPGVALLDLEDIT